MKYLIVYEKAATGWGAAPHLPGLGVAGNTLDEVKNLMREAVEFHLEGMREHGDPVPSRVHNLSTSRFSYSAVILLLTLMAPARASAVTREARSTVRSHCRILGFTAE